MATDNRAALLSVMRSVRAILEADTTMAKSTRPMARPKGKGGAKGGKAKGTGAASTSAAPIKAIPPDAAGQGQGKVASPGPVRRSRKKGGG